MNLTFRTIAIDASFNLTSKPSSRYPQFRPRTTVAPSSIPVGASDLFHTGNELVDSIFTLDEEAFGLDHDVHVQMVLRQTDRVALAKNLHLVDVHIFLI